MKLTEAEMAHPLWLKLAEYWESRLKILRVENDKAMNEIETARLRGRIAEVKYNLEMGVPRKDIDIE